MCFGNYATPHSLNEHKLFTSGLVIKLIV